MAENNIYQKIYDELEKYFPAEWKKAVYYAEYGEGVYQMEFFISVKEGVYQKCFDLPGVSMDELLKSFKNIDKDIKETRQKLNGKDIWTNLTVTIYCSGKFDAHFDYTDLTECGYEYKEGWKKKYLV